MWLCFIQQTPGFDNIGNIFVVFCYFADLYGLLFFLRVEPYVADAWWKKLLWQPFLEGNWAPMLKACSKLLWRNSKQDVAEEVK